MEEEEGKNGARSNTIEDCESFHDSDYDFSKDDDGAIYKNCIPTVDRAPEQQISNLQATGEAEGASKSAADEKRKMAADMKGKNAADVKGKNAVGIEGKGASEKLLFKIVLMLISAFMLENKYLSMKSQIS